MEESSGRQPDQLLLTVSDLREAADAGVIAEYDVEKLVRWASERSAESRAAQVEHTKGFNLVTVAYYFGAMLMISACAWFLGGKWEPPQRSRLNVLKRRSI